MARRGNVLNLPIKSRSNGQEDEAIDVERIAARLALIRTANGLTQADVSERLGMPRATWNSYEKARKLISVENALRVTRLFRIDFNWIYYGAKSGLSPAVRRQITDAERRSSS